MSRTMRGVLALALLLVLPGALPAGADVPHVLVFSGTYSFRHTSIGHGNDVLGELAASTGAFTVEVTENPLDLQREELRGVDVLLFNSTTGRFPLSAEQRTALTRFWGCGGGFIGIHAAADANYGWAEYAELIGAQFDSHPLTGQASLLVENPDHPANGAYADKGVWPHDDEFYRWQRDPRGTQDVTPLLALDDADIPAGVQNGAQPYPERQPVSWAKTFRGRGRVVYNNLGHNEATWDRAEFRQSLVDAIAWTAGTPLDQPCFDGDAPLPAPPAAPEPDPEEPREPCELASGEQRLTATGITEEVERPGMPAYFGRVYRTYVLDLSDLETFPQPSADVAVTLAWENDVDDYDLGITTPWGFAGSDVAQPAHEPRELARVEGAVHCARLLVAVYNHAAFTDDLPTITTVVDGGSDDPPAPQLPGLPPLPEPDPGTLPDVGPIEALIVAPPGALAAGLFAPPVLVIPKGTALRFANLDYIGNTHDITSDERAADGRPVFRSPLAEPGQIVAVTGVEEVPAGEFGYFCSVHPTMRGTLVVQSVLSR